MFSKYNFGRMFSEPEVATIFAVYVCNNCYFKHLRVKNNVEGLKLNNAVGDL